MKATSKSILVVTAALLVASATPSIAGGLFGPGGLIRGDIGNAIDKHVERPILTPLVQTTVVVTGYVAGNTLAGPLGGVVGAGLGQAVNEVAAGSPSEQKVAAVETGSTCTSEVVGTFPLAQPMPLNAGCLVKFENGKEFAGTVTK